MVHKMKQMVVVVEGENIDGELARRNPTLHVKL